MLSLKDFSFVEVHCWWDFDFKEIKSFFSCIPNQLDEALTYQHFNLGNPSTILI